MANEISRLVLFLFLFFISATQTSDDRLLWPSLQTISSLVPLLVLTALLTCSVPDGTRISRHFERATKKKQKRQIPGFADNKLRRFIGYL
jgi:hypothetical protein